MSVTQAAGDTMNAVSTPLGVTVSGALYLGFTVEQWVLILTALTVVGNLVLMGFKLFDAIRSRFFKKEE